MSLDTGSSTSDSRRGSTEPAVEGETLLVGRVARAHGNRGQVIVNPDTDFPDERFAIGQVLQVELHGRSIARRITSVRFHQGRPIVGFEGVETMNDAEALAGAELKIPASSAAPLTNGRFYHHDLVGCRVQDTGGRAIGIVTRVEGPMDRSTLVVDAPGGEVLVPLVADICVAVAPEAKTITIDPPEGLIELNHRSR